MKLVAAPTFPALALADGQTTGAPVNGAGTVMWSSSILALMQWNGTAWKALSVAVAKTTYPYSAAVGTLVPSSAGRNLYVALVTGAGTAGADTIIYDSAIAASGTKIGFIPGNTVVGTSLVFSMFAANGMWIAGVTGNCAFTLSLDK